MTALLRIAVRTTTLGLFLFFGLACGGCALIPVAALGVAGNVSDIGSTAFSAGTEVFAGGKLETVEVCAYDQAQRAIRSTLNDLRLMALHVDTDKVNAKYKFTDDAGDKTTITVHRRTAAICEIQVDVGIFGSEAYARLLLKSVRARLSTAANAAATQPTSPVDLLAPKANRLPDLHGDVPPEDADEAASSRR